MQEEIKAGASPAAARRFWKSEACLAPSFEWRAIETPESFTQ
jgi:hypothetical protein